MRSYNVGRNTTASQHDSHLMLYLKILLKHCPIRMQGIQRQLIRQALLPRLHTTRSMADNSNRTRYVVDQYVDPVYSDDSVNVNAVCSPRFIRGEHGLEVEVDFHNGWFFDSGKQRHASSPERAASHMDRLVRELKRVVNSPGRAGMNPMSDARRELSGPRHP